MTRRTVSVIPSAARLGTALRDVGYDFVGAVADLVDNSIAARATRVEITARFDGADSWLSIADNGHGMDATRINEALRFGSERDDATDDLGKFGLGLKTASLSQARRVTVASRVSKGRARVEARALDLDLLERTDSWEIEVIGADERRAELTSPLQAGVGTVVLWEKLDRVLPYRNPEGERARAGLLDQLSRLEDHLGMVFHRFIAGEVRKRKPLAITVNGNVVSAWDPFARDEKRTEALHAEEFEIAHAGVAGVVSFRPYVLPTRDEFSSIAEFERLGSRGRWNQIQGLWIYRANRLIQDGGWSRLRAADEHTKYARSALDFMPDLDAAFGINIAKMRVNLPPSLRDYLKVPVEALVRHAKQRYSSGTAGSRSGGTPSGSGQASVSPFEKPIIPARGSTGTPGRGGGPIDDRPQATPRVRAEFEAAASAVGESAALSRIVERLGLDAPEVARALGW